MIWTACLLSFILGSITGHYLREVHTTLKAIKTAVQGLKMRQDEADKPKPKMDFAEPMTRAELAGALEDEKIRLLNP